MHLQQGLWEHLRTLHNAWSSWWFIADRRCGIWADAHPAFLHLEKEPPQLLTSRWMCLFWVVSPFLVRHIHTSTLNIQAGGQQRERGGSVARGVRMVSFDALLFSLRCGCFWSLHVLFGQVHSRRYVTSSCWHRQRDVFYPHQRQNNKHH